MSQYASTLLSTDLSDVRLAPSELSAFLSTLQGEGIEFPKEAVTIEAAEKVATALHGVLPILALQAILKMISVAAMQAVLAGSISVVGLLIAPTLSGVVWWRGWSPVSILYAAAIPSSLSLVLYGFVPFIVTRFLAALRLRRLATTVTGANQEIGTTSSIGSEGDGAQVRQPDPVGSSGSAGTGSLTSNAEGAP
jgi:hypothetical protein